MYGDGRAISVGEGFIKGERWELQLKGADGSGVRAEWLGETLFEPCGMTCRVSSSFLRVGHLELFSRRVRDGSWGPTDPRCELQQLVMHAMRREYPEPWSALDSLLDSEGRDVAQSLLQDFPSLLAEARCSTARC
eukprot:Skav233817  [mRNA]  locus=scaffold5904:43525:47664:+ [translate_table: standard]